MLQRSNFGRRQRNHLKLHHPFGEKTMNFKPQDLANAGIGSISLLANATIDGIERLAALNLSAGRSFVEASFANVSALLGVTDVQSFVNLQQKLAAPVLEKGMEYSRNVIAITSETKDKIAKEVETQVAAVNANVSGLVEKALASAPAGSEVAVAAVKTAIKSANEAYEGLNKAAKQAVEVAEANVAAATSATLKAAKVVAPKAAAKKAA
jgi:phasin family protein